MAKTWQDELKEWLARTDGLALNLIGDKALAEAREHIPSVPSDDFWRGYRAALKDVEQWRRAREETD
ncbi:hypothetical protein SEA_ARCHIE_75 [Mycobacterium phage Archie]|uniref:Uncharacterized protein n=1 Tax=Mycobacterium phage Archie TaxID=1718599 RepID=A0A0M3UK93_9CAUD|nr:hypothetical protein AVU85_gp075 [Mycobacterium phage Archie]ALF00381.1 hypothetical protein SEA_ARCHIE_75 [Mycobacterium phage Archie]